MPQYKLYYFPAKGNAEPTRILFAYKDIKYEDIRISGDSWPEQKPNMPFGVMPVLEEDGKRLGGSLVVLRYLAEKPEIGLAGGNEWENAWLANIADFISDFVKEGAKVHFEKDEERKKELTKKFNDEVIPKYFGKFNDMAKDSGYLCCGRLTYPDLALYQCIDNLVTMQPEVLAPFPGLAKLKANIEGEPNIAKWFSERPKTEY